MSEARSWFEAGPPRYILVTLNKEAMTVLTYPFDSEHIVIADFHYGGRSDSNFCRMK